MAFQGPEQRGENCPPIRGQQGINPLPVEHGSGQEGLAHLVEHVVFLVRERPEAPTLSDRLAAEALTYNAYTNWDETHFTTTALQGSLRQLLETDTGFDRDVWKGLAALGWTGALVPEDFDSLAMVSIYYQIERSLLFFEDEGLDSERLVHMETFLKMLSTMQPRKSSLLWKAGLRILNQR